MNLIKESTLYQINSIFYEVDKFSSKYYKIN